MKKYLVMTRGIRTERAVAIDGGEAGCLSQELWIVPPGTTPTPRSDAYRRNYVDNDSARKFDEFSWSSDEGVPGVFPEELEAFVAALHAAPHSYAYVVAYAQYYVQHGFSYETGRERQYSQTYRDPPGTVRKVLTQIQKLLIKEYHFASSRIRVIDGGYRKQGGIEFWIVPRGEHVPIPTPNSFPPRRRRLRG